MAASVDPATRKRVLKVVFISLLLDLVSKTSRITMFANWDIATSPLQSSAFIALPRTALMFRTDQLYVHPPLVPQTTRILPES